MAEVRFGFGWAFDYKIVPVIRTNPKIIHLITVLW